ncbi:hypothetical protein N789_12275 [Arenimonas oryziterrae DSM 21050 = YC6267]|uniref:Uncharacterized protein n=2 Tax=Arenimonas TaxID=490567 RepID=A0A091AW50_9GAMM|nr:hypothetical protein N789_12275 [Arenimonas oryziterrae DSM 21050 = YC6267]
MLLAALIVLTVLAAVSVWLSDGPVGMKGLLSVLALGQGTLQIQREVRRPSLSVILHGDEAQIRANPDGELKCWRGVELRFRGRLASLSGRDTAGRKHHLLWWPDTLPAAARRALRLYADGCRDRHSPAPAQPA